MNKKELTDKLSLRNKGCTGACCESGDPYVTLEEVEKIKGETGQDVFTLQGEYFRIGKNRDGSDREFGKDPCPFYIGGKCKIQDIKPADCQMHPLFRRIDKDGNSHWVISQCCDAKILPDRYQLVETLTSNWTVRQTNDCYEHQQGAGHALEEE